MNDADIGRQFGTDSMSAPGIPRHDAERMGAAAVRYWESHGAIGVAMNW